MKAVIVNFRKSVTRQSSNQMVVKVDNVSTKKKAEGLVGKEVVWSSPAKKEIKGKVTAIHGNSGAVRVLFETGMPGQSVGQEVKVK